MKISWVIVSYGNAHEACDLAEEIVSQDADTRVVIACNKPGDAAVASSARQGARFEVRELEHNPGYFGALRVVSRDFDRTDMVILSNADLEIDGKFISELRQGFADYEVCAMIAPAIVGSDGADQNPYLLSAPSRRKLRALRAFHRYPTVTDLLSLRRRGHSARSGVSGRRGDTMFAPHGSCLIFTPNYRIGGGSFDYPCLLFGEELWCAREVRRMGAQVRYIPEARVYHHEHGTTGSKRRRGLVARSKYESLNFWVHEADSLRTAP